MFSLRCHSRREETREGARQEARAATGSHGGGGDPVGGVFLVEPEPRVLACLETEFKVEGLAGCRAGA